MTAQKICYPCGKDLITCRNPCHLCNRHVCDNCIKPIDIIYIRGIIINCDQCMEKFASFLVEKEGVRLKIGRMRSNRVSSTNNEEKSYYEKLHDGIITGDYSKVTLYEFARSHSICSRHNIGHYCVNGNDIKICTDCVRNNPKNRVLSTLSIDETIAYLTYLELKEQNTREATISQKSINEILQKIYYMPGMPGANEIKNDLNSIVDSVEKKNSLSLE